MLIDVRTIDLATGEVVRQRNVNFEKEVSRNWLDKHMKWALNNNHGLQMLKVGDKEPS